MTGSWTSREEESLSSEAEDEEEEEHPRVDFHSSMYFNLYANQKKRNMPWMGSRIQYNANNPCDVSES